MASRTNRRLVLIGIYVLSLMVPFVLENVNELFEIKPYDFRDQWYYAVFKPGFWYQRLVTATPRKPRPRDTVLVTLSSREPAEVRDNLCGPRGQRAFTARVLHTMAERADPAMIVFDKYYPPDSCSSDDTGTQELVEAMRELSKKTPVVLGLKTEMEDDLRKASTEKLDDLKKRGLKDGDQILEPYLKIQTGDPAEEIRYGLLRLNYDTRRIPLGWSVYESEDDVGRKPRRMKPTLAFVAAINSNRGKLELKEDAAHPLTPFFTEREIPSVSAIDLICNPESSTKISWWSCGPEEGDAKSLKTIAHKIAVFGERNPSGEDFHETAIGAVPGVLLQANYIESLLSDYYLKPVGRWLQIVITLLWFCCIEITFRWQEVSPERATVYAFSITAVLALMMYYFVIVNLGYYLGLFPPTLLAVVGRYLSLRLSKKDKGGTDAG